MRIDSGNKLLVETPWSHRRLITDETPASGGGHGIQIRRNDANGAKPSEQSHSATIPTQT